VTKAVLKDAVGTRECASFVSKELNGAQHYDQAKRQIDRRITCFG